MLGLEILKYLGKKFNFNSSVNYYYKSFSLLYYNHSFNELSLLTIGDTPTININSPTFLTDLENYIIYLKNFIDQYPSIYYSLKDEKISSIVLC